MKTFPCGVVAACVLLTSMTAHGSPPALKAAAEIDALLETHWKAKSVSRNDSISDEVFVRRVYLDLAGRIPTGDEVSTFLRSTSSDKRAALIDDLLGRES